MKRLRILKTILIKTHAADILFVYVCFILLSALVIQMVEPDITSYSDALWYCYAVLSTAGFGDIVAATLIGKLLSVVITIYSILVIAIVTGVVTSYYNQVIQLQQEETIVAFLDQLEQLPNLSQEELKVLANRAAFFRQKRKNRQNKP